MNFIVDSSDATFSCLKTDGLAKETPKGRRWGNWEIVAERTDGSFLNVFRVRPKNRNIAATYALKTLKERWRGTEVGEAILQREIQIGRTISHPHLLPVLDCRETRFVARKEPNDARNDFFPANERENVYRPGYFITPWLEGKTLRSRLTRGVRPTLSDVFWLGRQILEALIALKRSGWLHNDVKPDNIFLSATGHATLFDFGFALPCRSNEQNSTRRFAASRVESSNVVEYPNSLEQSNFLDSCRGFDFCRRFDDMKFLAEESQGEDYSIRNFSQKTSNGESNVRETKANKIAIGSEYFCGTPFYIAPERLWGTERPDVRGDLFSLGLVLFEMIAGKPHFDVFSWNDLARKYQKTSGNCVENDLERLRGVPKQAIRLLGDLTAIDRENRPDSLDSVLLQMTEFEIALMKNSNRPSIASARSYAKAA